MEEGRHYDVVIVGAGISGISAAYYMKRQCPDLTFTVLEGRSNLGGRAKSKFYSHVCVCVCVCAPACLHMCVHVCACVRACTCESGSFYAGRLSLYALLRPRFTQCPDVFLDTRTHPCQYPHTYARAHVLGTWDFFKYPGIRSDSDMFTFGFSWRPVTPHPSLRFLV